jgi:hypothetical protein
VTGEQRVWYKPLPFICASFAPMKKLYRHSVYKLFMREKRLKQLADIVLTPPQLTDAQIHQLTQDLEKCPMDLTARIGDLVMDELQPEFYERLKEAWKEKIALQPDSAMIFTNAAASI